MCNLLLIESHQLLCASRELVEKDTTVIAILGVKDGSFDKGTYLVGS